MRLRREYISHGQSIESRCDAIVCIASCYYVNRIIVHSNNVAFEMTKARHFLKCAEAFVKLNKKRWIMQYSVWISLRRS